MPDKLQVALTELQKVASIPGAPSMEATLTQMKTELQRLEQQAKELQAASRPADPWADAESAKAARARTKSKLDKKSEEANHLRRRQREIQALLLPVEAELPELQRALDAADEALNAALSVVADAAWRTSDLWKDASIDDIAKVLAWKTHFEGGRDILHAPHPHPTAMYKRQQLPEATDGSLSSQPIAPVAWAAALVSDLIVSVGRQETLRACRAANRTTETATVKVVVLNDSPVLQVATDAPATPATSTCGVSQNLLGKLDGAAHGATEGSTSPTDPVASMLQAVGVSAPDAAQDTQAGSTGALPADEAMSERPRPGKRGASEAALAAPTSSDRPAVAAAPPTMPVDSEEALLEQGRNL